METHEQLGLIFFRKFKSYQVWRSMLQRCRDKNCQSYSDYGGRGITVCDRWKENFLNFLSDMGERPDGFSIDRIDNDGPYNKENCRWATPHQQTRNYRRNLKVTINGRTQCVIDWAKEFGANVKLVYGRLDRGWPVEASLTMPALKRHEFSNAKGHRNHSL